MDMKKITIIHKKSSFLTAVEHTIIRETCTDGRDIDAHGSRLKGSEGEEK